MYKIVEFSHLLITDFYKRNNHKKLTFIDATCGMGFDSLHLAKTLDNNGQVIVYDIQEIAINETKKLLEANNYHNILYKHQSHEDLNEEFDLIIYNLGYLPNHDKSITTKASSSLESIKKALSLSTNKDEYLIIIVLYPGHPEGKIESTIIDDYCFKLPSNKYLVSKYQNYNRITSPYIITISKNKRS